MDKLPSNFTFPQVLVAIALGSLFTLVGLLIKSVFDYRGVRFTKGIDRDIAINDDLLAWSEQLQKDRNQWVERVSTLELRMQELERELREAEEKRDVLRVELERAQHENVILRQRSSKYR